MKQSQAVHQIPRRHRKRWRQGHARAPRSTSSARAENRPGEPRELVYSEDAQGHWQTPIVFRTDCPWTAEEMAKLTWKPEESGRLSTGFGAFKRLLKRAGFSCQLVRNCGQGAANPPGYEVVVGANGNY